MRFSYIDSALVAVVIIYLYKAPFTKVEESFTIQAIHDILNYGIWDLSSYDHFQFPGVVPRTFVGALIISVLTKPVISVMNLFGAASSPTQMETQILARSIIGLTNVLSLIYLKNSAQDLLDKVQSDNQKSEESTKTIFGKPDVHLFTAGTWFSVFLMTGFHLMYYSSRPLPNFVLTLPLANVAMSWVLQGNFKWAIFLSSFTAVIFRLEVLALAAGIALSSVLYKKISIFNAIKFGALGFGIGMGITLFVDSHFWQNWAMPEVDAFIFNVINGNAAKWGVEPFSAYFTHYLRMLFIPPTVLLLNLLGFKIAPTNLKIITLASYFHIFVLSFQPHKEWRFIVYALPSIIMLGSTSAAYIWENIEIRSIRNFLLVSLVPLSPVFSALFSFFFLQISSMNYPGGKALTDFNEMLLNQNITNVTVHMSVPVCMTGATLFGELKEEYGVTYDRTEDSDQLKELWPNFDYVISPEVSPLYFPTENSSTDRWTLVQTTDSYVGMNFDVINELLQQDKNLFTMLSDFITSDLGLLGQLSKLINRMVLRETVFFTYKRQNVQGQDAG